MGKNKPSVSPTQIIMYSRCGEQYRRRYLEKEVIPPGISLLKGISVHRGAELNFKQKIDSKADLPSKDVVDYSVSTMEETIKHEGLSLTQEEEGRGKDAVVGEAKDKTATLSKLMMDGDGDNESVAKKYQPILVEESMRVEISNSTHDLNGIIDLKTDKNQIVDIKTSAKTWDIERVEKDMQLTFYAMLNKSKTGEDASLIIENLVDLKKPKSVTLTTSRSMDDYELLINRINRILDGINKGVYVPAPADSWWCSGKFCGYYNSCRVRPRS